MTLSGFKLALKQHLPRPVLRAIREFRYARSIPRVDESTERDLAVVRCLLRVGDHAADIGANMGIYTNSMHKIIGPGGYLLSVEPLPDTVRILRKIVRRESLSATEIFEGAVSDIDGELLMRIPYTPEGLENIYEAALVGDGLPPDGETVLRVKVARLDTLLHRHIGTMRFIKMDVEGHELSVLRGGERVLRESKPALLIEILGDPDASGTPAAECFALLEAIGYSGWYFSGSRLQRRGQGERNDTYFFLREEHLADLKGRCPEFLSGER